MENSLFRYIWKYSRFDQIRLLLLTLVTFPILYLSLDLPKRIINDAIGGTGEDVVFYGITLTQIQFLIFLCIGFLVTVLVNGLIKMRLNTMKGIVAERLLRRLRYQMLTRIIRSPQPYFRRTSQGELVSMITSEVEPMGGLMGDLLSQPVFQAGQMLTILTFLFAQSFWFGMASVALIPLQAWLIPMLQRQINQLNKKRIQEIRALATDIGETAGGVMDLRTNGGIRYQMSLYSRRLGHLFGIRLEIFKKKYFMKFLNNMLNQLTPFFFYSVGGYLAIRGEITVGALVAALGAYKDIASPWNELLSFYNQTQDMAVRWDVLVDKFRAEGIVDDSLFEGRATEIPHLTGDIEFRNVTVVDEDGLQILDDISCVIPGGSKVAVKVNNETASLAFAELLTREVVPYSGKILIGGIELNSLHQDVIAARIGFSHAKPQLFRGTMLENILMPFRNGVFRPEDLPDDLRAWSEEASRTGNSPEPPDVDWTDPQIAGFNSVDEIHEWWFELIQAMGTDDFMVRRALFYRIDPAQMPDLAQAVVDLRPEIAQRIKDAGLDDIVCRFDPDQFNPVSPLATNLLYAMPKWRLTQLSLSQDENFLEILRDKGLISELAEMSGNALLELKATFGTDGTEHPLFRRLNLDKDLYLRLIDIATQWQDVGSEALSPEDFALMLTVPFAFSAEEMGPAFDERMRRKILKIRKTSADSMLEQLGTLFEPIRPDRYFGVMTLFGNAIYGRVSKMAGAREKEVENLVVDVLEEHGLRREVAQAILSVDIASGGENLLAISRERIAFTRAGIKKPDILVLENALMSLPKEERKRCRDSISDLLKSSTKIFIEDSFYRPEQYDMYLEIIDGRLAGQPTDEEPEDQKAKENLQRKLRVLSKSDLFSGLDIRQRRLLAFSSSWYKVEAGKAIFRSGQESDAAYLCVKGKAGVFWPTDNGQGRPVSSVMPGRLIGDQSIILGTKRAMDFYAIEDSIFLRIGAEDLIAVIENDVHVAAHLLRNVAHNLATATMQGRAVFDYAINHGVDYSGFEWQDLPKEYSPTALPTERNEDNGA